MKLHLIALPIILFSSLYASGIKSEAVNTPLSEQEKIAIVLEAVLERWEGQEDRIQQLMYEASLVDDKPMDYYNGRDCVATFDAQEETVVTYLKKNKKYPVRLTYAQFLELVKPSSEDEVSESDLTIRLPLD